MVARSLGALALLASICVAPRASAQVAGPPAVADSGIKSTNVISRVSLYRFAEGKQMEALADLRTHLIPVWEAEKQAGIIVNYSTMANITQSSPNDWQLGIVISYKNFQTLDSLGARINPITLRHYGSAAARTAAAEARAKLRVLVSSQLVNISTYSRP